MATSRGAVDATSSTTIDSATPSGTEKINIVGESPLNGQITPSIDVEGQDGPAEDDAFGNEEGAEIQYKTCNWW